MREIKFRGRDDLTGNGWVYGDFSHGYYGNQCLVDEISVVEKTVGQFTGLKDSTGKEIYEGDVVEFNDSWHDINGNYCEKMQRGYIKYDYGEFAIVTSRGEAFLRLLSTCVQSDTLMVIGNVHDNPELLKGDD